MAPLIAVKNLSCLRPEGDPIFLNVNFDVNEDDIIVIQSGSGVGKTTLLKCIAHLSLYHGTVDFKGKPPKAYGIPTYRTYVQYIPQRPSLLPGTPRDLIETLSTFRARHTPEYTSGDKCYIGNSITLAEEWDIKEELWDRPWNLLSVGEAQRLSLAIAYGLNRAEILLLDEPTSALDTPLSKAVEKTLVSDIANPDKVLKAIIWVTHSEEQADRVGKRFLRLTPHGVEERSRFEA
ncbi:P-loop containing nucleoside triphosphate hydrolase protein [Russula earlei]|uniref:P-loop containing nucleoside triphosphate hydrolase protein n=1 Tax=Russula earlei TaxID=71964 RepID=A0ACC0UD08_9AGAM|nr:P-loop containing nucleoside triphosphate hydrolase protein [Russula earlei]